MSTCTCAVATSVSFTADIDCLCLQEVILKNEKNYDILVDECNPYFQKCVFIMSSCTKLFFLDVNVMTIHTIVRLSPLCTSTASSEPMATNMTGGTTSQYSYKLLGCWVEQTASSASGQNVELLIGLFGLFMGINGHGKEKANYTDRSLQMGHSASVGNICINAVHLTDVFQSSS